MLTVPSKSAIWDIFCKVVDNFGDAGVCWRLAQILQHEHGLQVRLWMDDLVPLQALCPGVDCDAQAQCVENVDVRRWVSGTAIPDDSDVVVEAFGCGLPDEFMAQMAACAHPPLWIVLEYLSAEAWVDEHHGLASPHPQLALKRWFFFPGFTARTGGLLRETDLLARRDAFGSVQQQVFWRSHGTSDAASPVMKLSLFAYANAPVVEWLTALAQGTQQVMVAVPGAILLPAVQAVCGSALKGDSTLRRGALEVRLLPFLPQAQYDELLWACDFNLVRGEDSFVRAQWAARPLVWQPYRQDDGAHQRKMEAFLGRYGAGLPSATAAATAAFWRVWNGEGGDMVTAWAGLQAVAPDLVEHARRWADQLAAFRDLAAQLVEFAHDKVE